MIDEPDEMLLRQSMTYRNLFHLDIYGRDSTGHVIMCQVSAPPPVRLPAPAPASRPSRSRRDLATLKSDRRAARVFLYVLVFWVSSRSPLLRA